MLLIVNLRARFSEASLEDNWGLNYSPILVVNYSRVYVEYNLASHRLE